MEEFETIRERMEREIQSLKNDTRNKDETIQVLEKEITNLKQYESYAEYKGKYEEISRDYDKEKERLTKLFRLYEETESECNTLKKEVAEWQNWFNENEDLFNKLFTSAAHLRQTAPAMTTPAVSPETTHYEEPGIETETSEIESDKPKKRLRFKK